MTNCSLGEILVLRDRDEPVGYVWPQFYSVSKDFSRTKKCRIHMFGILPSCRGKGKGKRLMLEVLNRMKKTGYQSVELTVDSENLAACKLYRSLGFYGKKKLLWFEKSRNKE
jgi:ribosomal protein S18 acetylase RimI-like enzyme